MSSNIKHYYDIGEKVIFKKSGRVCTITGYYEQYYKLKNHKGRLIITPDCGLKRIREVGVAEAPVVHRVKISSVKFSDNASPVEVAQEVAAQQEEVQVVETVTEVKPKLKKAKTKAIETKAEVVSKSKSKKPVVKKVKK